MDQFLTQKDIESLNSIDFQVNLLQLIDSLGTLDLKSLEDPLKLLFNVSFIDDERDLLIIALDKKKKIITLKVVKRTEDDDSEEHDKNKKSLVYNISNLSEIKNLIKILNSVIVYVNPLYEKEPNIENVVYEKRFSPLNDYQELYDGSNGIFPFNPSYEKTEDMNQNQLEIFAENFGETLSFPKLIVIEYEKPFETIDQNIYQRVFLVNDKPNITVYESLASTDLDIQTSYNKEFDALYIESINGKRDGEKNRFWEFYVNGEIGRTSIDKQELEENDVVEWRLAESKGGCGGAGGRELSDLITLLNKGGERYLTDVAKLPWYII